MCRSARCRRPGSSRRARADGRRLEECAWWRAVRASRGSTASPFGLGPADMLVVEPGESHTFVSSSDDYLHYGVQAPFILGDKTDLDQ